jgi:hypothetical protein
MRIFVFLSIVLALAIRPGSAGSTSSSKRELLPIAISATVAVEPQGGTSPPEEKAKPTYGGPLQMPMRWRNEKRTEEQGVKLARWCVVEDACVLWPEGKGSPRHPDCGTGGKLSSECKAMVEVAVHNRKLSHETWDDTFAFLVRRIMGDEAPRRQRGRWIKDLPRTGTGAPVSWVDCRGGATPCDGDWRLYGPKWAVLRAEMVAYWQAGPQDVCERKPLAEGTEEDAALIAIPHRGFERYECEGVTRLWIGGPSNKTISAKLASSRSR